MVSLASNFNLTPTEAVALQKKLREQVSLRPLGKKIRTIAGVDLSFNKYEKDVYAGIMVFSYPDMKLLEYACIKKEVHFPYIPGLLSFREIPPLLDAWKMLKIIPDVVVVDGHGIAHPRRLGIATHFGLATGVPTVGCAKSLLYGKVSEPDLIRGSTAPIIDPKTDDVIGIALRTKDKVKPVFISAGNKITLKESQDIIVRVAGRYRIPEPTRNAHNLVNAFRKHELGIGDTYHYQA